MLLTSFSTSFTSATPEPRRGEPISFGLPLPPGVAADPDSLIFVDDGGATVPVQWTVLDRWPADNSIRWVLADARLSVPATYALHRVDRAAPPQPSSPLQVAQQGKTTTVASGAWRCAMTTDADDLLVFTDEQGRVRHVLLTVLDTAGLVLPFRVTRVVPETTGPLRTTVCVDATAGAASSPALDVRARVSLFAGLPIVRLELTVRNPRRAEHPGGYWELGDPGSVFLRDASVVVTDVTAEHATWSESAGAPLREVSTPTLLYQDSSGGSAWRSRVHVNRKGDVPVRTRGYELIAPQVSVRGERATPVVFTAPQDGAVAVAVQDFWQNFPKSLEADGARLVAHLFPGQFADEHELQGGEQKSHVVGIALGEDPVGARPLDWVMQPAATVGEPRWYAEAGAAPYLTPAAGDPDDRYEAMVRGAVEGPESFERKREAIDEYGWRHFGDLYADHESVSAPAEAPVVSHYNNQYDPVAGFAVQFMRSGDSRWWSAMNELARHVTDIDVYHSLDDKAAYSGGLFWHTYHYKDAGRATHRSYPRAEGVEGGGPSNEQNYTTGLMYCYYLTGQPWAKDAAVGLADWVIRMDDGRLTVFRWLTRGETGLASSTRSTLYHGPGRGAGNSIVTLLNAFRLTGHRRYLQYAEALIRRCVHPDDDVGARDLLDAENKWSYTVFLQALARYLDDKATIGEIDCRYGYAKESLLAYARWMATHEYPYLEKPAILEYPTETWAAQDMRKCEVFLHAMRHAEGVERATFAERADFFYRASLDWLHRFPTRTLTRPVVLLLSYGFMYAGRGSLAAAPAAPPGCDFGVPAVFEPQKIVAKRRAVQVAIAGAALTVLSLGWLIFG